MKYKLLEDAVVGDKVLLGYTWRDVCDPANNGELCVSLTDGWARLSRFYGMGIPCVQVTKTNYEGRVVVEERPFLYGGGSRKVTYILLPEGCEFPEGTLVNVELKP